VRSFWKNKLAAYLHDPPSKCADIATHDLRSERALRAAGFSEEELRAFAKQADLTASSADRFPFPGSRSAGMTCAFDGVRAGFHHPLGGARQDQPAVLSFESGREVTGFDAIEGELEDREQTIQPVLNQVPDDWSEEDKWRARFFAHWRLWPQFAAERDARFAFLPADTRLPDHTIWTHNTVVAALAGCADLGDGAPPTNPEECAAALRTAALRPAFLKFQLGPVQDFIAQARSTRDLWSGSYLLSWLMAAGLKALSAQFGPDAVIYPNLRNQPLFDLHWRVDLWERVCIGDKPVWQSLRERARRTRHDNVANNPDLDLLTPNLPNVFFAIVPAKAVARLGQEIADAIRGEWRAICESVWQKVQASGLLELCPPPLREGKAHERFVAQTERIWNLSWHALPWPVDLTEARQIASRLLPAGNQAAGEKSLLQRFDTVIHAATQAMPKDHRDPRYYKGGATGPRDSLNNIGLGWALLTALSGWSLDAVRQTRDFRAWSAGGWGTGVVHNKDGLTGREEMLFGGSGFADKVSKLSDPEWSRLFRHDDEVGAITLVKRVWHWSWLAEKQGLRTRRNQFPMPNTRMVADHKPFESGDDSEDEIEKISDEAKGGKYFAVLALDGDSIGKWVSGEKCPSYRTQLATYSDSTNTQAHGSLEYFTRPSDPDGRGKLSERFADLLRTRRLVSPSYHLQFSEALSNFAVLCARPIVEAFDGRLIYAGGDDVLAMLPADSALDCARALRNAFRGTTVVGPDGESILSSPSEGFLATDTWKDDHGRGRPIPFLVPGPAADCSVGIAIAHFKAPLQDVVRAAQAAEKRAKKPLQSGGLGRGAVAVTLMKRSGEMLEWGCRWNSRGLELLKEVQQALAAKHLNNKFPHRVVELLEPYLTASTPLLKEKGNLRSVETFDASGTILAELNHALDRQCPLKGPAKRALADALSAKAREYLTGVEDSNPERLLQDLIGLMQTAAFAHRTRTEPNNNSQPKGSQ